MLRIEQLDMEFGKLSALSALTLTVNEGDILGLIGPNGSGKTTLFNVISGFYRPTGGRIMWQDEDITGLSSHLIARKGIARTFQNLRLFDRMDLFQNVWAAQHQQDRLSLFDRLISTGPREAERRAAVEHLLEVTGLIDRRDELVKNLPLPEKRRLELARALARNPRLILLDEPAGGMTAVETEQLSELIRDVAAPGHTIIVIEHKMDMISKLCNRVCVLNFGSKIAEGDPETVLNEAAVLEAYLGRDEAS